MPNTNYLKGVRKERSIVNESRKAGFISFRSAGSHSPIDVVVIDLEHHEIKFLQCKQDDYSKSAIEIIKKSLKELNNPFLVRFDVV